MSHAWNTSTRGRNTSNSKATHQPAPVTRSNVQVQMGASWRKKMDEVEARIKKEQGNLGVLDGEVKLKTKEKEYLKIKLQRLVREQENLREGSALEELSKVVAEQAAKTELLKSSNLVLEQHGLEVVSERKASGALKRKAEAARTEAMTIADCRRPKRERVKAGVDVKVGVDVKAEPALSAEEGEGSSGSDSSIEYDDDDDEEDDEDEEGFGGVQYHVY